MRPEPPADYRPTVLERIGLGRLLPHTMRMILRQLERHPIKAILSCVGIAMGVAVLILGSFSLDAINYIMDFQFRLSQTNDMSLTFVEPTSSRVLSEVRHLPGVLQVSPVSQRVDSTAPRPPPSASRSDGTRSGQ